MAVTYNTAAETARMTATRDYFANGSLEIMTAADAVLATFGLSANGGTVAGSVWTLAFDAGTIAATGTGTAAKAQIKTNGGDAHLTGLTVTATGGGGDIIFDNTSIVTSQSITLSSGTITHS